MAFIWHGRHPEGATVSAWIEDPREPSGWRWDSAAPNGDPTVTQMLPITYPDPGPVLSNSNPPAETAGDQDHTDPWLYAGEDADPPGSPDGVA